MTPTAAHIDVRTITPRGDRPRAGGAQQRAVLRLLRRHLNAAPVRHGGSRGAADSNTPFPYEGPDNLRDPITRALEAVLDPEVAMNIVDIGLVYGVTVAENIVHVKVTMTSAACPVADVIVNDIEQELDAVLPDDLFIQVDLVWEPPWTATRMSAGARRFMGW